ncbi:MAG: hypothetical protein EA419_06890 [Wenzhouxiangella sp.]|nr:MAG: hypothetical protein EA419_06890 [Wenzhouxiangella sp.]
MRKLIVLLLLPALGLGLSLSAVAASKERAFTDRWIVELIDAPTLEFTGSDAALQQQGSTRAPMLEATAPSVTGARRFDARAEPVQAYARFLDQRQAEFIDQATAELGRKIAAEGRFRHVANGLVVRVSAAEAERLRALPGVLDVHRERLYRLELLDGPELIGARAVAAGGNGLPAARGEGTVVAIIDSGINWNHRAFSDDPTYSDGYSYTSPYGAGLGLCSQSNVPCNDKLVGVYDFTDDSTDGRDSGGHGTHVAAIAVGNEWQTGIGGVAPRAHVISYRVCVDEDPDDPDAGSCQGGAILEAVDQAVVDGVDVVNFSIGAGPLDPWSSVTSRRVLNLRDAGIAFVTSAGNAGPDSATVGWPAEAPWVFAVGSSTHRARTGQRVTMSGIGAWFIVYGEGSPPLPTPPLTSVPLRAGDAVGGTYEGCEAFPANAFDGGVALLRRGGCLFSEKVNNAADAGAVAVIMVNNVGGDPIVMGGLEGSSIPAGMVRQIDGAEIRAALAGGERPVSMPSASLTIRDDSLADQVSGFSSRGPSENAANLMKPNVVAPGQGIQAAFIPSSTSIARQSGTSMASPHVAGSMALLRQLAPSWTPAMLTSALETTAETAPVTGLDGPADIFERGAGRVRVDRAARAGLYLPVTRTQFLAANPDLGGDPGALNLPGLVNENCAPSCTFTRTVRAIRDGSWTVSGEGEVAVSVSPDSFTLDAGQSRELTITVTPTNTGGTELQHGAVVLTPPNVSAPVPGVVPLVSQRLPIGVRSSTGEVALPEFVRIEASANQGRSSLNLGFVDDLPEAVFRTSALVRPTVETFSLPEDPRNDDPYDGSAGTRTFLIDVPEGTLALWAETTASSAPDIDLFVGRDDNGDGRARASEERCMSITPDELERCVITSPQPGQWWVVVQNWAGSAAAQDSVTLELAVLGESDGADLVAFGPGRHSAGPLSLDLYWDRPDIRRNERMLGVVGVSSRADALADVGAVPVAIERSGALVAETTILFSGETWPVTVPANGRHDKLIFDVPPTASAVSVNVQGDSGVSGTLRRVPFSAIRETAPATPAPSGPALASGSNSAAGFTLARSSAVEPGRYFVELENGTSSERVVEVSVTIDETAATVPRFGLWSPVGTASNPRDEISQGIEWQQAGDGFVLWYSYDPDGLPVFYLGTTDLNPDSSVWVSEVGRFTLGDGDQLEDLAGTVGITAISAEEMVFSWRLNGGHGSDIKRNLNAPTCPTVDGEPVSYTGTWFTPGQDQGGSSVVITDNAQGHIRYYYDGSGVGRWVLASDGGGAPLEQELEVLDFRGFCPNCAPGEVSAEVVGTYFRAYDNDSEGFESLQFISRPPLDESIDIEVPIVKLSSTLACP